MTVTKLPALVVLSSHPYAKEIQDWKRINASLQDHE